jgi:amino acid transporter
MEISPPPLVGGAHLLMKSPQASLAPTTSSQKHKYRVLGTVSLLGVCFMAMAGGPPGSEPLVSIGGPLVGLVGIALYFLLCLIPIALMVTELCCTFPENGGFAVWTMAAFGPYWGFQAGYWAWITSVINNAIYPGLVYKGIMNAAGVQPTSESVAYLIKVAIAVVLAMPSYIGVRFIGIASLIMMLLVITCTTVFSIWGLAAGEGAFFRLAETRGSDSHGDKVDWTLMINWLLLNFDRLHWISMIAGEVQNPARTYPRVILFTISVTLLMYVAPLITSVIGNKTPWRAMDQDTYQAIASALGGSGLHSLVVFSSMVTFVGLFANSVFLQSFLIQGMAQSRLLPSIFRKRSVRFKTPKYAVLASLLTTAVVLALHFDTILSVANGFSSAAQVMIVLSMLQLRRAFPNLHRPKRVPGSFATVALMLLTPFCVFLFIIGSTLMKWETARIAIAFVVPGLFIPFIRKWVAGLRIFG